MASPNANPGPSTAPARRIGGPQTGPSPVILQARSKWSMVNEYKAFIEQLRDEKILTVDMFNKITGSTDIKDLVDVLKSIPGYGTKKRKRFSPVRCWDGFLGRLKRFERVLDTLAQASGIGCLLWGAMKALIMMREDICGARDIISNAIHEIIDVIDQSEFDVKVVESDPEFRDEAEELLIELYNATFQFLLVSIQFASRRPQNHISSLLAKFPFVTRSMFQRKNHREILGAFLDKIISSGNAVTDAAERFHRYESHKHIDRAEKYFSNSEQGFSTMILKQSETIQLLQASGLVANPSLPNIHPSFKSPEGAANWDQHLLDGCSSGSFFVGRESEMSEIHLNLKGFTGNGGTRRVVVCGMGGIGKSHLVHEYAVKHRIEYRMICWIDCTTLESFHQSIDRLIWALGLQDYTSGRPSDVKIAVMAQALSRTDASWLLIMDNCTSLTVDDIIKFLPRGQGDVIFTTNEHETGHRLGVDARCEGKSGPHVMSLGDLSKEESIRLLLYGLPSDKALNEQRSAEQIVSHIQGHPLSLRLAHSYTRLGGMQSMGSYEETLFRIENVVGPGNPLQKSIGSLCLRETIKASLLKMSPAAQWMLKVMSCFHNNNIPDFLLCFQRLGREHMEISNDEDASGNRNLQLERPGSQTEPPESSGAVDLSNDNTQIRAAQGSVSSQSRKGKKRKSPEEHEVRLYHAGQVEDGLRECEKLGLICRRVVKSQKRQRVVSSIHPAVHRTVRELSLFQDPQRKVLRIAVDLANRALPDYNEGYLKLLDWREGEELQPHAAALELLSRETGVPVEGSLNLLYKIALRKYLVTGDQKGAEEIATTILGNLDGDLCRRSDGEFAFAILLCRMIATYILWTLSGADRHFQARHWEASFIKRVLEESVRRRGPGDERTIQLKSYLATALSANRPTEREVARAVKLREEVVKETEKRYGKSDTRTILEYANLGFEKALHNKTQYDSDTKYQFSDIIAVLQHTPPESLENEPDILFKIMRIWEERGNVTKMKEFAEKSLRAKRNLVSQSHPHLTWHFIQFVKSLACLKEWEELAQFLKQEPLLEGYSGPYFETWTQKPECFEQIYTSNFFKEVVCTDGRMLSIVEYADSQAYWTTKVIPLLDCSGPAIRTAERRDDVHDVALLLDKKNWSNVEDLIGRLITYTSGREVEDVKIITGSQDTQYAIHGLIWLILGKTCFLNFDDINILAVSVGEKVQTSYQALDPFFVHIWDRMWHRMENTSCNIGINDTRLPDRFFETPPQFTSYLIRVVVIGSVEATKLVLKRGADVHYKNPEGKTAFYYAAEHHHFAILRLLLDATKDKPQFYFGETTLPSSPLRNHAWWGNGPPS